MQALQPRLQALKEQIQERPAEAQPGDDEALQGGRREPAGRVPPDASADARCSSLSSTCSATRSSSARRPSSVDERSLPAGRARHAALSLPLLGNAVSVLPVLMGAGMLVQSKLGGSIAGPESSADAVEGAPVHDADRFHRSFLQDALGPRALLARQYRAVDLAAVLHQQGSRKGTNGQKAENAMKSLTAGRRSRKSNRSKTRIQRSQGKVMQP